MASKRDRLTTGTLPVPTCRDYHPLFCFNQFGDLERALLREGNVSSADDWYSVLEPVVARYRDVDIRRFFRGDAAFARPELYEYLELEGYLYAIRLPANEVLYREIEPLLTRPVGRPPNRPKEGKNAVKWTRLSCHDFVDNQVRLQLFALAYKRSPNAVHRVWSLDLGNFLRRLALPRSVQHWSLTTLREKLIKTGAKVVAHSRYVFFQMAEVAVPKRLFRAILDRIRRLRLPEMVPG